MVAPDVAHAARSVAGRGQCAQPLRAKGQGVTVTELVRSGADAAVLGGGGAGSGVLGQQGGAGDVVGVCMGFQGPDQAQPVLPQQREVALNVLVYRVDDHRFARAFIEHQVGVGARGRVEQLNGLHGVVWVGLHGVPAQSRTVMDRAAGVAPKSRSLLGHEID